jgi:polysaccharide pyruvyl transferase WcaK-like protein
MHEKKRMRIAFLGHFDSSNFGNECTLQAILHHLHCHQPDVDITCITTGPEAAAATHQIAAIPISPTLVAKFWLPQKRLLKWARSVLIGIPSEPFRWIIAFRELQHIDALIIAGTGLLTDAVSLRGWGPYNVFKWSLIAKTCGCKLLFVSVGAGPIYTAVGRWLIRSALSLAEFRSYRDTSTLQYLRSIGFPADKDRVFPDLAFSLPAAVVTPTHPTERGHRPVIGLGLMVYAGKYGDANPNHNIYRSYLQTMADVVTWLQAQDNDIRLLIGDVWDLPTTRELMELLHTRLPEPDERHIIHEPIASVKDLLSQIASADIVVATRFHNVLLAFLREKPAISISFHHKCASLMSAMGLSAYCLDIKTLKADQLIERICYAKQNAAELKLLIRKKNAEFRQELDRQYRLIFGKCLRGLGAEE